jgi:hypothetical protein
VAAHAVLQVTPQGSLSPFFHISQSQRIIDMSQITVRDVFEHHYGKLTDEMICGIQIEELQEDILLTPVIFDYRTHYDTPCSMHTFRYICIKPPDENSGYFDLDVLIKNIDDKPAVAFLDFFSFDEDNSWFRNSLNCLQNKQI